MLWNRKPAVPAPVHDRSRTVGLDLTSTRIRAVSVGPGRARPLILDEPHEDLLLFAHIDRRLPEVGRTGYGLVRKLPHATASNFVPQLGYPRTWTAGRNIVTPESALSLAFEKLYTPLSTDAEAFALALPAYLTPPQARKASELAAKAKLPLRGTVSAPLALAARLADVVLGNHPPDTDSVEDGKGDWIVPIRPPAGGPGSVVVLDADEFALTGSVICVELGEAKLVATANWPRLSLKAWKDRLLDSVADRCVRLCRKDPRDSADAEQALFEQLDDALERARFGQKVSLSLRAAHWYQDVTQQPADFDGYCTALAKLGADSIRELVVSANLPAPPRAVWLTPAAGRLPGLANAVYRVSSEATQVAVLSENAVAEATAALVPRWLSGELPRVHLDAVIPVEMTSTSTASVTRPIRSGTDPRVQ